MALSLPQGILKCTEQYNPTLEITATIGEGFPDL